MLRLSLKIPTGVARWWRPWEMLVVGLSGSGLQHFTAFFVHTKMYMTCTYTHTHTHTLTHSHSHTHTYRQTSLHQQLSQFSFPVPLTLLQSSFRCIYMCCFALFVCLILLASFFLPSHLSFKNMYIYSYIHPYCTC